MGTESRCGWPRVIVHADMDAFYAAVEQRDHPEMRGRPVVVGGVGRRGVVSTASYEARPFGVHSAMPTERARRLCPQAVFVPPDFPRYEEASSVIMKVFESFSPLVEPLSLDEAFLDMTGAEGIFGPPEAMGRRIKDAVAQATEGLTVSVGVAPCKFVAKVASDHRKPDGLTVVPPEGVLGFLWPLDVSRLWGVGPKTREALLAMGLERIEQVARASPEQLAARLGALGEHIHRLAWGRDARDVVPDRETKSIGAETTLEEDLMGADAIRPHLRRAAERVASHLRREGMRAGGVRVKLKTASFETRTRQSALPRPTDSEPEIARAAELLLAQFDLSVPMRLVGLAVFRLAPPGAARQPGLFDEDNGRRRRSLEAAVDTLRSRFGEGAVRWGDDDG